MEMRMPREEMLDSGCWIEWHCDKPCRVCALGWIHYQAGRWKTQEDTLGDLLKDFRKGFPKHITSEFISAHYYGNGLEYIAQVMRDLGHEPVYDPECTDPPWMTPIEAKGE